MPIDQYKSPEYDPELSAVDYYNLHKQDHALTVLEKYSKNDLHKQKEYHYKSGTADIVLKNGVMIANKDNPIGLTPNKPYTPFMILSKFKFKGNHDAAKLFVEHDMLNKHIPFVRVGVNYFKRVDEIDRFGIKTTKLNQWSRQLLMDDYGKTILNHMVKFDGFINAPDHLNYQQIVGTKYNLYKELNHVPKAGEWEWTKRLLEHIFQDKYEIGLKYMQALYLHPTNYLPILVLGSRKRSTGKTTFVNWLNQIFGDNAVVISPDDLTNSFNSTYANSSVIAIEETVASEKSQIIEKLKALSAGKFITLNMKNIAQSKLNFYGHFIITTNEPRRFLKVDSEEIRFFIRDIPEPKFLNTNIEDNLRDEIPAFLHHLINLPALDWSKSRMLFTKEELRTKELEEVIEESKTWLYKELNELLETWFNNNSEKEFVAHPNDIKQLWFSHNSNVTATFIRKVLKDEFMLEAETRYYQPLNENIQSKRNARVFVVKRESIIKEELNKYEELKDDTPF